jgi:hypothetical protein
MRKIYLLFIILFSINTNAQIAKNKLLLGGNVSYAESRDRNLGPWDTWRQYGAFSIEIGKALKQNAVLGLHTDYLVLKETYTTNSIDSATDRYKNNSYGIGVFYRKYKPLWKDLYLFGQANTTYIYGKGKDNYYSSPGEDKITSHAGLVSLTPGISYQLFRKIQASITLNNLIAMRYEDVKRTSMSQNARSHRFAFNTAFQNNFIDNLGLGFHLVL